VAAFGRLLIRLTIFKSRLSFTSQQYQGSVWLVSEHGTANHALSSKFFGLGQYPAIALSRILTALFCPLVRLIACHHNRLTELAGRLLDQAL